MRKRPTTPPPPDESQFFTVVNPWPQQPHLAVRDSKAFARWIASIVGQANLHAFYHKPKSPRMVVVEVSKDGFIDLRRLLGEHRWREVLQIPNEGHADEVSSIFPCTMTTPRSLQKECWQQVDVEASWFHMWSPEEDSDIVCPYPLPRFCHPPQEDVMRNPLCRPLRQELFHEGANAAHPAQPFTVPSAYRSFPAEDPSDDDADPEYESSGTDDRLPTPFGVSPPGLAPLPGTLSSAPFVTAIHGADAPKSDCVTVVLHHGSDADTEGETLWAGYGETEAPPPADLCGVHGIMCSNGICRQRGMRKREEVRAKRVQARFGEREAWNGARDARQERRGRRDWGRRDKGSGSDGGSGSGREGARVRDDLPEWTTKGKSVRGANSAFSTRATADSMPRPAPRAMPAHLCKGTTRATNAESGPELATLATTSPAPSTTAVPVPPHSSPSSSSVDGEGQSVGTSNSSDVSGVPSLRDATSPPSTTTASSTDLSRGLQQRMQPLRRAPMRWADMVEEDEDSEDEDNDEVGRGKNDFDDFPRGVTVIPGTAYGEDGADGESVFSGWDEDAEPF